MKIQKYHIVVKVQKSNRKIVERNKMDTPNTNKALFPGLIQKLIIIIHSNCRTFWWHKLKKKKTFVFSSQLFVGTSWTWYELSPMTDMYDQNVGAWWGVLDTTLCDKVC